VLDVAEPALLPGELLAGKYRIERVLGQGGMGVVLGARNVLLGKRVAVKLVKGGAGAVATPRLLMEARAAARLESDHAVRIFDVGHTEQGDPYLVMEHLEGCSLAELCRAAAVVSADEAVLWVLQTCEALAEAHAQGVVHRDVKPANLFLEQRPDGSRRIKVLDFGIAKLPVGERLATTTHALGSPVYMAPEQLANDADVDHRADVWGIGCVLYELLAGRAPFEAGSVLELAAKITDGSHPPLHSLRPALPEGLSRVVDQCLEVDRTRRFRDLAALGRALSAFAPAAAKPLLERIDRLHVRAELSESLARESLEAGEETRDLPSVSSDVLRESAPALESSLSDASSVSPNRPAHAASRALNATLAAVSVVILVFTLQRSPREAAAVAPKEAAKEPSAALHASSAARREPEPRVEPEPLGGRSDVAAPPPTAASSPTKPSARRALPRAPRPKTNPDSGTSEVRSPSSTSAVPRGAGPLPLDRDAPW
jgi:eukaryotic-like serine/threonine-protein kinase